MLVAKTSVGEEAVLIEMIDDDVEVVGNKGERQTQPTGIEDTLGDAYKRAKDIVKTMAVDFAKDVKDFVTTGQKVELEFTLGLSATTGLWVISGKGEAAIKVKMTWEK